jgi:hypothetical protein
MANNTIICHIGRLEPGVVAFRVYRVAAFTPLWPIMRIERSITLLQANITRF